MSFVDMGQGIVVDSGSKALSVRFFYHPFIDHEQSRAQGRPIYQDAEMIEITIPGSRDNCTRHVEENDKILYARLYESFKAKNTEVMNGTPLTEFPFITSAERKEMEYFNIFTAEQLIGISDTHIDKLRLNTRDLIKKVKAYMETARDTAYVTQLAQEKADLERKLEAQQRQIDELKNLMGNDHDGTTRKRKAA